MTKEGKKVPDNLIQFIHNLAESVVHVAFREDLGLQSLGYFPGIKLGKTRKSIRGLKIAQHYYFLEEELGVNALHEHGIFGDLPQSEDSTDKQNFWGFVGLNWYIFSVRISKPNRVDEIIAYRSSLSEFLNGRIGLIPKDIVAVLKREIRRQNKHLGYQRLSFARSTRQAGIGRDLLKQYNLI